MSFQDDYYETRNVSSGRGDYTCEFCGESIPKGTSSACHKYYPEFHEYRTHLKCSAEFLKSEMCDYCGEITNKLFEIKEDDHDYLICQDCFEESKIPN